MNQTILLQPGEKNENRPFDNMVKKKHKRTVTNYKRPCDFEGQDHQCLWQTWHSKKKIRSEFEFTSHNKQPPPIWVWLWMSLD